MKCSFCGTENAPGRTHCIACGTPLTVTENNLMANDIASGGGMSEPIAAPTSPIPEPSVSAQLIVPPTSPTPPPSSPPRVEVEYAPHEVAEMQMPTNQIRSDVPETFIGSTPEPAPPPPSSPPPSPSSAPMSPILPPGEGRPGPWLALTVLSVGIVVIIGIIYFGYQLIFGGGSPQPTITPTVVPTVTTTPTASPTPTIPAAMSPGDQQRERDIVDLQTALERYFTDKEKYPKATNYSSMLNSLISGQYLTRRIQDPLFPSQQYQYTVDPDQQAYELVVNFESSLSSLLSGGSTTYRFRSPAKN
ncbi:MAG: hypothetical protein A2V81_01415 [Candidatus Abawacabacteria bacterium RBG_16_42_10]|uniref:Zinc-ribbon domain-containing protein n=1 Tax=Candidatus Abawacabacteria bacterium RBG_16_42_10 TaxID=1817814 RepID=A0A1F4XLS0_9BACT|nr:MAG: hypothetical protein A2V81_01415 [Candidatus Abawacabacteria bacterium RBG_16_42_10]